MVEFLHQLPFFFSKGIGIRRVDGGEVAGAHLVFLPVYRTDATLVVYVVEETAVMHLPFRMTPEYLSLLFELDDGDGLVHLCCQQTGLLVYLIITQQDW